MGSRIDRSLVLDALLIAVWRRQPKTTVVVHSDQGSQFRSHDWQDFLKSHNLEPSMSRRGNCHDNAVAESFFQLLKRERVRRKSMQTGRRPVATSSITSRCSTTRHVGTGITIDSRRLTLENIISSGSLVSRKSGAIQSTRKPASQRRSSATSINAMSEKLTSSHMWKWSFKERRCLIPMSSWDEWPETGAGKQRVRVSMPGEPVFMFAGLYDANVDPKTGEEVDVYTICTVPPNEFLGTVHDRAPMVLMPSQYEAWLEGGQAALALVGVHPNAEAFAVKPV